MAEHIEASAAGPVLQVDNVQLGYGDLTVVWDVSLTLRSGQTTALLGRNGAGKSTLLAGIAGLLPARAGRVAFDGNDVTGTKPWKRVEAGLSYVQEGKRILRSLTVHENLLLGLPRGRKKEASDLLDVVYGRFPILRERRQQMAGSLSGGQQQMLLLGTAMAKQPRALLIDEPSSGLAPVVVDQVLQAVDEFKRDGMAVLLVEQLVDEVMSGHADDVIVLDQGRVVLSGAVGEVSREQVVAGVFAG
jgi:branched-chain amino acid transport system ATP-binding protein